MDSGSPCLILANAIQNELCQGISVSADILHYMKSVSGMDSLEGIRQILRDDASSEGASLFALILFPDEGFQMAIEALLETFSFNKADEKTICNLLMSRNLETVLHFPGIGSTLVTIPPEAVQPVITRLNISRNTDPRIIEALRLFAEEPLCARCRIRLRNSGWIQCEAHVRLLRDVIEKFAPKKEFLIEILDVVLEFLTGFHAESDMLQSLESEKERLIHLLDRADRQDHLLRTSPVEAIMLQGVRMVSVDRDEIIRRIRILDQVCRTVIMA